MRDVRMIQRRERLRLAREPRHSIGIGSEPLRQDLQRDITTELRVACAVDLAHATRPKGGEDFIGTEPRAGGEDHGDRCGLADYTGGK